MLEQTIQHSYNDLCIIFYTLVWPKLAGRGGSATPDYMYSTCYTIDHIDYIVYMIYGYTYSALA